MYCNCCCSYSFERELIKISQSSHKMYSNKLLNFQESTTILNACTKKSGNLLNTPRTCDKNMSSLNLKILLKCSTVKTRQFISLDFSFDVAL